MAVGELSIEATSREALRRVGNVGSYVELRNVNRMRGFFDEKEVHHILPKRTLERLGLSAERIEGAPCIVLTSQQHELTLSHGGRIYGPFRNLAEEIEANITNVMDILRESGEYTAEIEHNVRGAVRLFVGKHSL